MTFTFKAIMIMCIKAWFMVMTPTVSVCAVLFYLALKYEGFGKKLNEFIEKYID